MGIGDLSYCGVPLAFMTGTGFVHTSFVDHKGMGWLRTWPGSNPSPYGLTQVGSPCFDGEQLGLHGRVRSLSAQNVSWGTNWSDERSQVWTSGRMVESRMFGEKIELNRIITMFVDEPGIEVHDVAENKGFQTTPFMFLQHINLGFPLLTEDTILKLPPAITNPRNKVAAKGVEECCKFSKPIMDYEEQVFCHYVTPVSEDKVNLKVINPKFDKKTLPVTFNYLKRKCPILVQGMMMRAGNYIHRIGPVKCHVESRSAERERGSLVQLEPGEVSHHALLISFDIQS